MTTILNGYYTKGETEGFFFNNILNYYTKTESDTKYPTYAYLSD